MTYVLSQITAPNKKIDLYKDLFKTTNQKLKKLNKDLSWLQYAKTTKRGNVRFLAHKQVQWNTLEAIATTLSKKHDYYSYGQVIDLLSHLVNHTIQDEINANNLTSSESLNVIERSYLKKLLIEVVGQPNYISLYPWIMPVKTILKSKWLAKNLTTDNQITITKSHYSNKTKYDLKH
jgi:hypothetical protein